MGRGDREDPAPVHRGDAHDPPGRPLGRAAGACRLPAGDHFMRNERGFALLSVMLVLALLAVVVTEFSMSARLESSMIRSYRDGVLATHLAEGAVQQALREILGPGTVVALDDDGSLSFYRAPDTGAGSTGTALTKMARL